jgi:two-component system cell cycle sensor histidine kinase/response regulator CckA
VDVNDTGAGRIRVLIVDDAPEYNLLVSRRFRSLDSRFEVRSAESLEEAGAALKQKPADVVIVDHQLPDGSGLDLVAQIRRAGIHTACVVISGDVDDELIASAFSYGADDVFSKEDTTSRVHAFATRIRGLATRSSTPNGPSTRAVARRAAEAIAESEKRLHELLSTVPDVIYRLDLVRQKYDYLSPSFEVLTGYPVQAALDDPSGFTRKIVHPEDLQATEGSLLDHLKQGPSEQPIVIETRLVRKDGTIIWVRDRMRFEWEGDKPVRASGVMSDIADRKRAEEALRESEERHRRFISNATDIIYGTDAEGRITFGNDVSTRALGYPRDELIGKHYLDFIREDKKRSTQRFYQIQFLKKTSDTYYEVPAVTVSGAEIWLGQKVHLVVDGDEVVGFEVIARDITEKKLAEQALRESEERMRRFTEAVPEVLYRLDMRDARYDFLSPSLEQMLGYPLSYALENPKNFTMSVLHPDDRDAVLRVFSEYVNGPRISDRLVTECRMIRADGEVIWVRDSMRFEWDEKGVVAADGVMTDITERKKAEEKLERAHSDLDQVSNAAVPLCVIGRDLAILKVNDTYCSTFQVSRDDVVGRKCSDIWHSAICDSPECPLKQITRGKLRHDYEWEGTLPDGSRSIYAVTAVPYRGPDGEIIGIIENYTDITKRKWAEEEAERNSDFLNSAIESLTHPFLVIDANNYSVLIANTAAREEASDGSYTCFSLSHGRSEPCSGIRCPLREVKQTGEPVKVEHVHLAKDGSERIVEVHAYPIFDENDNIDRVIEYHVDVTERKEAEEALARLATAVEHAGETILITDTDGTILYVNPAFERVTGYTREEAVGENPRILSSGIHDKEFWYRMWQTLCSGGVWSGEIVNKRKDGSTYTEESNISPIRDSSGAITGYVAVKMDITDHKEVERVLEQLNADLQGFVHTVSHDLRAPLSTVASLAELLSEDLRASGEGEAERTALQIRDSVRRLHSSVEGLLTFAHLGSRPVEVRSIDVRDPIREALSRLGEEIRQSKATVVLPQDPTMVLADHELMVHVFQNLFSNALRYSVVERRTQIEVSCADAENGNTAVSVSDNGRGIDMKDLSTIFEAFSTGSAGGGTGLGLAIVKRILEAHDGSISVSSELGRGTTFTFFLPRG